MGMMADIGKYIPLFRGAGKRGFQGLKATEGGVYGDGVYFYTDPLPARSHATTGGGVITGYAKPEDVVINGNVAVLKDPTKFIEAGKIPVEDTLVGGNEWAEKTRKALSKVTLPGLVGVGAASFVSPERANAEALQEPTFDPTSLLAGPSRLGGGMMNMGMDALMRYFTK